MSTPVLHLLAGPNGAGKTTLATRVLLPTTHLPFVSAEVIAAERWPGAEVEHAYEATALAETARQEMIQAGESFITETVFSHEGKVDLVAQAVERGYLLYMHIVMVPVDVSVGRVAHRVRRGGDDVPEQKVRERYERLWPLLAQARKIADRTVFYDNENDRRPYRIVAQSQHGQPVGAPEWPTWAPPSLL